MTANSPCVDPSVNPFTHPFVPVNPFLALIKWVPRSHTVKNSEKLQKQSDEKGIRKPRKMLISGVFELLSCKFASDQRLLN